MGSSKKFRKLLIFPAMVLVVIPALYTILGDFGLTSTANK